MGQGVDEMDTGAAHIGEHMELVFHRIDLRTKALLAPLQLHCLTLHLPRQGMGLTAYLQLGGAMARTRQHSRTLFFATNIVKLTQALALYQPAIVV